MRKSYSHISVRVDIEFWLALHAYIDAHIFLHQTLTFIQTLTHTLFNTYTHLHTHLATCILRTNSIRRLSGRAAWINFTSTVTLNPFQKTYNRPSKIIFCETRKNYYGTWPPQGGPGFAVRVRCPFFRFHSATFSTHRFYISSNSYTQLSSLEHMMWCWRFMQLTVLILLGINPLGLLWIGTTKVTFRIITTDRSYRDKFFWKSKSQNSLRILHMWIHYDTLIVNFIDSFRTLENYCQ